MASSSRLATRAICRIRLDEMCAKDYRAGRNTVSTVGSSVRLVRAIVNS